MSFLTGFSKTAKQVRQLSDAELSGLYANLLSPAHAAQFSAAKRHKDTSELEAITKHRSATELGGYAGMGLGGLAGGILGQALTVGLKGVKGLQQPPTKLFYIPLAAGGFIGGAIGKYIGAKKGHEAATRAK